MQLLARRVDIGELEDADAFVLAMAERPDTSGWQLVFMLPLRPSEQDRELGLDTYSVSSHEGVTAVGGITGWRRHGDAFELELVDETAQSLGLEPHVTITLGDELGAPAAHAVEDALRRIVG